jgi:nitroimidazol reductase NimA-like FMN-containing flavoprotein (pyridoxamine 5'-phosphate oxidase superfamily)
MDGGFRKPGEWALNISSVVVFGRVEFVEDRERIYAIARALSRKFTDDEAYIEAEVARSGPGTCVFCLVPEHMTGKIVNES